MEASQRYKRGDRVLFKQKIERNKPIFFPALVLGSQKDYKSTPEDFRSYSIAIVDEDIDDVKKVVKWIHESSLELVEDSDPYNLTIIEEIEPLPTI